ncbi:MAG: CaiB/BaiF CoA transferase family protein [Candidatus Heimdallarchaeota archaeon]
MTALKSIKVLDLTRLLPGGYCTQLLGDMGADVIKIEQPGIGDYIRWIPPYRKKESGLFLAINRNKKSMTLNLKATQGQKIFYRLVESADVIIEGYRPGVVKKLGVDYETVKAFNPKVIYCSLSGYGQDGPYQDWVGHDINYIGIGGILGITGAAQEPVIPGVQIADLAGGGMLATIAILAALFTRERIGVGQYIDVAMLDGVVSWLSIHAGKYFIDQEIPIRGDMPLSGGAASYNIYETKDGQLISLGILEKQFWKNLCRVVGREDLEEAPYFELSHREELKGILQEIFLNKNQTEWIKLLNSADVPCGPVNTIDEVFKDPQVLHRNLICEMDHPTEGRIKQLGIPIKFSETPGQLRFPPPQLGEHSTEILRSLGYTKEQIQDFQIKGVI